MKKLLLFSALLIFACSSDDSTSDDNNQNSIIGNWQLTCICEDGLPVEGSVGLTPCESQSNMTFLESNTGNYEYYDEDGFEGDCIMQFSDIIWSQENSSSYYVTIVDLDGESGTSLGVIDGDTLTINDNGIDVVFVKN
tara:strand:+ start:30 stop:443 length:414 start_codon:yes stop_codon:yes gene_type:complete